MLLLQLNYNSFSLKSHLIWGILPSKMHCNFTDAIVIDLETLFTTIALPCLRELRLGKFIKKYKAEKGRSIYKRKKETIECSFAEAKVNHSLCYVRMLEIWNMRAQSFLNAAVQNVKRLVTVCYHFYLLCMQNPPSWEISRFWYLKWPPPRGSGPKH